MQLLRLSIVSAWRALRRNKMRSGLTVLGISIGVGAVITMVGVGQGAGESLQGAIKTMGKDLVIIQPGAMDSAGAHGLTRGIYTLVVKDAEAIRDEVDNVDAVSYLRRGIVQTIYDGNNWSVGLQGTTPTFLTVENFRVDKGVFFDDRDVRVAARKVVLGRTVVNELFGDNFDPVGDTIKISGVPFEVIGVFAAKGKTPWGQDLDDLVAVPFTTAVRRVLGNSSPGSVDQILVSAKNSSAVEQVKADVTDLLRERHSIRGSRELDFRVNTLAAFLEMANTTTQIMAAVLASISSISLIVGGIGIMNILLVSVTERTREIGIRMAVGAKKKHILSQFLIEAIVMSTIGGLIGVVGGGMTTYGISYLAGWPTVTPLYAIVGAVVFSATIGIFFGFYPARKAASLDPIGALRFE